MPHRRFGPWLLGGLLLAGAALAVMAGRRSSPTLPAASASLPEAEGMVRIPRGTFRMGDDRSPLPEERPAHEVTLEPFWFDTHEVTNRQFAEFVVATGYVTTAERQGGGYLWDTPQQQWAQQPGTDWRHPLGPASRLDGREEYPVVQVSWSDAAAYAAWAGKQLPTEAQWECAARAGLRDTAYPWGNETQAEGRAPANTWQGPFPDEDLGLDGFRGLAPVGSFPPNRFGLVDVAGNVAEWCSDWYAADAYLSHSHQDPKGPGEGTHRVIRGGSYRSPETAPTAYRSAARSPRRPEASYPDVGFRCVRAGSPDRS